MNPRIIAISGPLQGQVFPILETDTNIGRGSRNHIKLDDPLVALRHCCIVFENGRCLLAALEDKQGTFVNGFCFPGKILVHCDRIRVGGSMFVFLDRDEFDEAVLQLTPLEKDWDRSLEYAPGYETAASIALATFVQTTTNINAIRDPDEVQARVFEWIFRVIPLEGVVIRLVGHDQDSFISSTYARADVRNSDPFPIDAAMTLKVLHEGKAGWSEKVICCPMTALDTKVGVIYAVMSAEGYENVLGVHIHLLEAIASFTAITLKHLQDIVWLEGENRRLIKEINVEHGMVGQSGRIVDVCAFISR